MFSKEESAQLRKDFWTAYGVFMRKHTPTADHKIKWLNYRTGIKDIYFRLEADKKRARICIDLQHRDEGIRELYFEQFQELKKMLELTTDEVWQWEKEYYRADTDITISRIYLEKEGINCYVKGDWSEFFHFFQRYQVPFDAFWGDFKGVFEALEA